MGSERRSATPVKRDDSSPEQPSTIGIHYSCDSCFRDISNVVRAQCAVCDDVDLCVECFGQGVEFGAHARGHDYRLIPPLTFPGYTPGWRIDEELLFLEAVETCGLGNWIDISEHVGGSPTGAATSITSPHTITPSTYSGKTPKQCLEHFFAVYLPERDVVRDYLLPMEGRRYGSVDAGRNGEPSLPAMHEIAGYMPGRDEFETESPENEFEAILKDFFFRPLHAAANSTNEEPAGEEEAEGGSVEDRLKMCLLKDVYGGSVVKQRRARHWFLHRWRLTEFKRQQQVDKQRSREDRDAFQALRPFARFLTLADFATLHGGLCREEELKRRIAQLQEYRRHGLRSLSPAVLSAFEGERKHLELYLKGGLMTQAMGPLQSATSPLASSGGLSQYPLRPEAAAMPAALSATSTSQLSMSQLSLHASSLSSVQPIGRKASTPLNIANADGVDLLSDKERQLCSLLRLYPRLYLHIKDVLIREYLRLGGLKRAQARAAVKIDVNKTSKLYDFFTTAGWIRPPASGSD